MHQAHPETTACFWHFDSDGWTICSQRAQKTARQGSACRVSLQQCASWHVWRRRASRNCESAPGRSARKKVNIYAGPWMWGCGCMWGQRRLHQSVYPPRHRGSKRVRPMWEKIPRSIPSRVPACMFTKGLWVVLFTFSPNLVSPRAKIIWLFSVLKEIITQLLDGGLEDKWVRGSLVFTASGKTVQRKRNKAQIKRV